MYTFSSHKASNRTWGDNSTLRIESTVSTAASMSVEGGQGSAGGTMDDGSSLILGQDSLMEDNGPGSLSLGDVLLDEIPGISLGDFLGDGGSLLRMDGNENSSTSTWLELGRSAQDTPPERSQSTDTLSKSSPNRTTPPGERRSFLFTSTHKLLWQNAM